MKSSQRGLRWGALLLLAVLSGVPNYAYARVQHTEAWARDRFAAAERMREALNGRPPADRTRHDYQRVVNAYRNVYFGAPASTKADPSVVAVAETLVEMGRRFEDDKILNESIAQYKFLRKEYPGSKYRCDALFTIGEIYKDDLNDPEQAREVFQEFLHRYPQNRLVEDAQRAVVEIDREAEAEKKAEAHKKSGKETAEKSKTAKDSPSKDADAQDDAKADTQSEAKTDAAEKETPDAHSGRLPRVTGIRHWSTPDYTRVAIDLESDIKFGSSRISSPDRIFFDLRGTKLASTLVGKSFDVDDGFLKKIRVAQFQPGRTRVVLEVADLSDYEAFLLPNPYRLIIDIHGKGAGKAARAKAKKDAVTETADVEAPPKAGSKTDVSKDVPKNVLKNVAQDAPKDVPKSELKADMKALAGKPVSKTEQIHDQPSAASNEEAESAKAHPSQPPQKGASNDKATSTTVKRVVVEADDDDDAPPVKTAKAEAPAHSRKSSTGSHKTDTASDSDSAMPDEKAASDSSPTVSSRGKSTRLSASRKGMDPDVREARPTASGDRSLIRALGLKIGRIVIDPGHGGHDTGTIGPDGLQEKDLVLEVGRRLGKLLETRLGAEVVYTRKNDTFIPLETRTAIANQQRADLFISIHANSSNDSAARGVETYYLNFTSSPEALEVAARENAVSEKSIYELQDLVKKIALKEKIEESREFAGDVQESLHSGLAAKSPAIRNRGVKKAPFIVLIGANMPSILAEISFVSNPADEHRLETSEYRQRIAESLYRGIAKYADGLSGVKMASKLDKAAGQ
ncbi:MAG TPA: N-acetylmuramoyl-L-alanine amidase [Candidatus Sulfotelmatobacter sp.]